MPRPKNAKIWNEDLVIALGARAETCRREGSMRYTLWKEGQELLEGVRGNIYMFQSERIVNLPPNLSKTVREECHNIIRGLRPILPEHYVPVTLEERRLATTHVQPTTHPFLKAIRMRSGSYAILMAFHFSMSKTLTKEQIIKAAQVHCDEQMDPNWNAGRIYAGWSSIKTVTRHGFLAEGRSKGSRGAGKKTWTLTSEGSTFIQLLIKKFPYSENVPLLNAQHNQEYTEIRENLPPKEVAKEEMKPASSSRKSLNSLLVSDRKELQDWIMKGEECRQRRFRVGSARREKLLQYCQELSMQNSGLELITRLDGEGNNRAIYVFIEKKSSEFRFPPEVLQDHTNEIQDAKPQGKSLESKPTSSGVSFGDTLSKSVPPPVQNNKPRIDFFCDSSDESEDESIVLLNPRSTEAAMANPPAQTILIDLESSDESSIDTFCQRPRGPCTSGSDDGVETGAVEDSPDRVTEPIGKNLVYYIDNRERTRNTKPREMMNELRRHLESGGVKTLWPAGMPGGEVEVEQLKIGDFQFSLRDSRDEYYLPVAVERKRVGDLVRRSSDADHWRQLQGMRDACDVLFFLIEGRTSLAGWFSDETVDEENEPHSIQDEDDIFRFMTRAILSTKKIRFLQTKDEQCSYRAIGTVGLIASVRMDLTGNIEKDYVFPKQKINWLHKYLMRRGIHWKIARQVAEEVGSVQELASLYERSMPSCRPLLMATVVECITLPRESSEALSSNEIVAWSKAIHSAHFSSLPDPEQVQSLLGDYKVFLEEHQEPHFIELIHKGVAADTAARGILGSGSKTVSSPRRVVIEGPPSILEFLEHGGESSFEIVHQERQDTRIPRVNFQTFAGDFCSGYLQVVVIDGEDLLTTIQKVVLVGGCEHVSAVAQIGSNIVGQCDFMDRQTPIDRRVLVVKRLPSAVSKAAKDTTYRAENRAFVDLLLAELMIAHEIVVLQAIKASDLEKILMQFAKSCLRYQLLHCRAD